MFTFSFKVQRVIGRYLLCMLSVLGLNSCGDSPVQWPTSKLETPQALSASMGPASEPGSSLEARARVIVKFRVRPEARDDAPSRAAWASRRLGAKINHGRALGAMTQSMHAHGIAAGRLIRGLQALPEIEWAVEDRRHRIRAMPNDPLFLAGRTATTGANTTTNANAVGQWFLGTPNAITPVAIDALRAWDREKGKPDIVVAVLDSGVVLDHPDLAGKLKPGYDFVSDFDSAADGTRRDADPNDPGDATAAGECDPWEPAQKSSWHGTQVAGLIGAATDNGIGVASAGRNVSILPVRVLGKCGGYDSDIIAGMMWAGGLSSDVGIGRARAYPNLYPARVINLSLGTQGNCSRAYLDVIGQLSQNGVTVVAAAGNDTGFGVATPANCPGVIAVAGLRHIGTKVGYSNIGPEVSLAAPAGNCVNLTGPCLYPLVTTTNAGRNTPTTNTYSDGENASVGTSFAAPLVAATAALMIAANQDLSPADIKSILKRTARPFPRTGAELGVSACKEPSSTEQLECYCTTSTCGAGFLNTFEAVSLAADLAATQTSYRTNIDIYNAETNRLQMAKVEVGELSYFNVSVSVDQVIALGEQSAVVDRATRYDAVSGLLQIAEVMVGRTRYRNVTVTVKEVLQVGVP